MYDNERMIKINITLWSIVLVVAVATFIALSVKGTINKDFNFSINFDITDNFNHSNFVVMKEQVITEEITDISVEWISNYVNILKSENNEIKIVQKAAEKFPEDELFSYRVSGGKLLIKDGRKNKVKMGANSSNNGTGLEIYLPEKKFNSIDVNTTSAHLDTGTLTTDILSVNTTSGDIDFSGIFSEVEASSVSGNVRSSNAQAQKININTTSGDARITGSFKKVNVNTVSGEVEIQSSEMLQSFKSNSVSGDVTLFIPENNGFTIDFDKVSGKLKSDFAFTVQGDTHIYKNGEVRFSASTVSGNVDIVRK